MKSVYILPNGQSLGAGDFCRYFEKKVLYTVRKFGMSRETKVFGNDLNSRVLRELYEKFGFIKSKSKVTAIGDSTDDVASMMVESWFDKGKADFLPSSKKMMRPFLLMTDEEIGIYAAIKHLSGTSKKKNSARTMLDEMEKKHPEIKRAIVQSYLQLLEIKSN